MNVHAAGIPCLQINKKTAALPIHEEIA